MGLDKHIVISIISLSVNGEGEEEKVGGVKTKRGVLKPPS
jgi:hypothetical protein